MQHPQAAMAQQPGVFAPRAPLQFNPQQMQEQQQQQQQLQLHHQHQQAIQGHMSMRPGTNNGMHTMHNEAILGGGSGGGPSSTAGLSEFTRGGGALGGLDIRGSKQDVSEAGSGDGQGTDGEPYLKGSEDAN